MEEDEGSWTFKMNGHNFTFAANDFAETFRLFNDSFFTKPTRPEVEIVTITLNGRTMEVPLSNETVDALFERAEEYKKAKDLKERKRRAEKAEYEARQEYERARAAEAREKLRRDREEAQRRAEEAFRKRRQSDWRNGPYGYAPGGSRFSFDGSPFEQAFPERPGNPHKPAASLIDQLAGFAEMDIQAATELPLKKLWLRAQRKCHPDTGGSHEKWLELEKLEARVKQMLK